MTPIISIYKTRDDVTPQLRRLQEMTRGSGNRELLRTITREFWLITRESFGANRPNRPADWPVLSEKYKKQLRRKSFGTSLEPTLLRAGTLLNSIRLAVDNENYGTVWTECDYATVHQFGNSVMGIPARPFFPVEAYSQLTPYAENRIRQALEMKVQEMIRNGAG